MCFFLKNLDTILKQYARNCLFCNFWLSSKIWYSIFGPTQVKQSKKLKKTQEKAIRMINFKDRTEATNPLFTKIKIMKVKNILIEHSKIFCLFVHDQINEKSPNTFAECFIIVSNQHSYNTRGSKIKLLLKQ